jgi:hypothetical protein
MTLPVALLPPRLRAALDAGVAVGRSTAAIVAEPLGAVEVAIRTPDEAAWADGLFGAAGFVLAASDDERALMAGVVQALPLQIAMLVGLEPRPLPGDREMAVGAFGSLETARTARGLPEAVAGVLAAREAVHWSARATWASPDGPATRAVVVIDGGPGGLLLCTPLPGGEDVALMPCSSTDVWRLLCALLPYPSEIL